MKTHIIYLIVCFALSLSVNLKAQSTGTLSGTVVDAETGETLIGVNLVFEGTLTGTNTDLDGNYTIRNIEPGTYTLLVSYVSFQKQTITGVEIEADETLKLDITLQPETEELEDVIVTASAILDNEAGLLRQRQKSIAFSDAISAESISNSGAGDAAAAMSKVTGATVVGGKYVFVRGLGGRYSSTHMNGIELPSSDPNKKSFQMDLIPSNLLDNIVTLKTFTPDKPGNFSGGIIDIGTKSFPEDMMLKFSYSNSYNQYSSLQSDFLSNPGGERNSLGFWKAKNIPGQLSDPSVKIPTYRSNPTLEDATLLDSYTKLFDNYMGPVKDSQSYLSQSFSGSFGNQFQLFNRDFGFLASYTYGNGYDYYDRGRTERYRLTSLDSDALNPQLLLNDSEGTQEVSQGFLVDFQYKISPNNKIGGNYFSTKNQENTARYQDGIWTQELGINDTLSTYINRVMHLTERKVKTAQLRGDHVLENVGNVTIEWSASRSFTSQDEPDLRYFTSITRVLFEGRDPIYTPSGSGWRNPSRYFRYLDEDNVGANLDIKIPFKQWSGESSNFKVGGSILNSDRTFRERIFSYNVRGSFFGEVNGDPNEFFSTEYLGIVSTDTLGSPENPRYRYNLGNVIQDNTQEKNNYDGSQDISSIYGMIELPLNDKIRFVGGARYESTDIQVSSMDTTRAGSVLKNDDLLPSLNLIYEVIPNMNLRASLTRTLARPNMRELVPYETIQFVNDETLRGNPDLKRTLITNYDLRWEWFMGPGEILGISGYYKHLENPIELAYATGQVLSNPILQYQNVDEATIRGVEFEFRKSLDFIAPMTRYLSAGFNLSLIDSDISLSESELEARRAIDPDQSDTRDLQGQSPYVINADINYQNPNSSTVVSVYYNVFGARLSNVGAGITPDVYERPRPTLDLTASQTFLKHFNLNVGVQNILNSDYKQTYSYRDQEFIYQKYSTGRTFKIGISYSL